MLSRMHSHLAGHLPSRCTPYYISVVAHPEMRALIIPFHHTRSFYPSFTRLETLPKEETQEVENEPPSKTISKAGDKVKLTKKISRKPVPKNAAEEKEEERSKDKPVNIPKQYRTVPPCGPTSYSHWFSKHFYPSLPIKPTNIYELGEANKRRCEAWKLVSEEEKEKFSTEAAVLRREAAKKRQEFINAVPPEILKEINRRRAEKRKEQLHRRFPIKGEKRPATPYIRFAMEFFSSTTGKQTDIAKMAGERWRNMSDADKTPFYNAFREEMTAYRARKAAISESS